MTSRANENSYRFVDDILIYDGLESAVCETEREREKETYDQPHHAACPKIVLFALVHSPHASIVLRVLNGGSGTIQVDSVASSGVKIADT